MYNTEVYYGKGNRIANTSNHSFGEVLISCDNGRRIGVHADLFCGRLRATYILVSDLGVSKLNFLKSVMWPSRREAKFSIT